jgi:hypothetical protein
MLMVGVSFIVAAVLFQCGSRKFDTLNHKTLISEKSGFYINGKGGIRTLDTAYTV